jgi:hypothetical protein
MRNTFLRTLTLMFAFLHAFPAKKHLALFLAHPSLDEAWKGFGAAIAIALYLLPVRWQARALGHLWYRRRSLLVATGLLLSVVHLVPATDHLPRLLANPSWPDAWRAIGAMIAVAWFLMPLPVQARTLTALTMGKGSILKVGFAGAAIAALLIFAGCGAR